MKDEDPMGLFTPSHVSDTMAAWNGLRHASNRTEKDPDFIILQKTIAYCLKWFQVGSKVLLATIFFPSKALLSIFSGTFFL